MALVSNRPDVATCGVLAAQDEFQALSAGPGETGALVTALCCEKISVTEAQALARTVEYGNAHYSIYPADCLTRSLVLQYLLTRRGGEAQLCLGVRKLTGQFEAHAWVEVEGVPLNELETVREIYTALDLTAAKDRAGA